MTTDHLADRPLKLATCPRCGAYVLAGQLGGLRVAVDPVPASTEAYRAALLDGRKGHRLVEHGNKPHHVADVMRGTPLDQQKIMLEHGCAVRSARPVIFEEVPENPPQAPVTPGGRRGGRLRSPAPGSASREALAAPSPVRYVKPRLSDTDDGVCVPVTVLSGVEGGPACLCGLNSRLEWVPEGLQDYEGTIDRVCHRHPGVHREDSQ